jgi:hypothetical protein
MNIIVLYALVDLIGISHSIFDTPILEEQWTSHTGLRRAIFSHTAPRLLYSV